MNKPGTINYVEFCTRDIQASKHFFVQAFGWIFQDYGPRYAAFSNQNIDGGFTQADHVSLARDGGVLIVLYSDELETTQTRVEQAGGVVSKPIFSFPGGRRFHFIEPGGNELAVWSEK